MRVTTKVVVCMAAVSVLFNALVSAVEYHYGYHTTLFTRAGGK